MRYPYLFAMTLLMVSSNMMFASNQVEAAQKAGQGVTGTYSCSCTGGVGTCSTNINKYGDGIECKKQQGDTCSGSCSFSTGTSGISTHNIMIMAPHPSSTNSNINGGASPAAR
jgi:hypothetical protein